MQKLKVTVISDGAYKARESNNPSGCAVSQKETFVRSQPWSRRGFL